jgi:hypothetical protein
LGEKEIKITNTNDGVFIAEKSKGLDTWELFAAIAPEPRVDQVRRRRDNIFPLFSPGVAPER